MLKIVMANLLLKNRMYAGQEKIRGYDGVLSDGNFFEVLGTWTG